MWRPLVLLLAFGCVASCRSNRLSRQQSEAALDAGTELSLDALSASARETLNKEPIHDRIYLAGEPFNRQKYGTAHGAFISGTAAAKAIVAKRKPKSV